MWRRDFVRSVTRARSPRHGDGPNDGGASSGAEPQLWSGVLAKSKSRVPPFSANEAGSQGCEVCCASTFNPVRYGASAAALGARILTAPPGRCTTIWEKDGLPTTNSARPGY